MTETVANQPGHPAEPVFGFLIFGGPLSGAMIRDIRLANELARRGFRVHLWWAMDKAEVLPLDERITQHWLFSGARYANVPNLGRWGRIHKERLGRFATWAFKYRNRVHVLQRRPMVLNQLMVGLTRTVCDGIENDRPAIRRFAREIEAAGVTHLLPMLSILGPWVQAVREFVRHDIKYLVTFQGYELYAQYARDIGLEPQLYQRLRDAVAASDYNAIAVSSDYRERVNQDIGVPLDRLVAIPPGVPPADPVSRDAARALIERVYPDRDPSLPLVTFLGRRDAEKGIDLLLYAAAILRQRGVKMQLAICGPTLFGAHYAEVCRQIAENLRCPVLWGRLVKDDLRTALFAGSDLVVYPSIHREPFGMVAAEAMSHGTPVVVPRYGGIADVVESDGEQGGLTFDVWDSGDLADKIQRLIEDQPLRRKMAEAGPRLARRFSVESLADRVLAHMNLPPHPGESVDISQQPAVAQR